VKRSFELKRIAPAVVAVIAALAGPAAAQSSSQKAAAAQALFDDGMALLARGNTAAACPKLAEAQRLDPGMATQFRLAECHEKAGRTATAWQLFLAVADSAQIAKSPEREALARQRAAALAPGLTRMKVLVPAAVAALPGLQIQSDGVAMEPALWGVVVPVDPVEHSVVATAPNKQRWEYKGSAAPGTRSLEVTVPMLQDPLKTGPIDDATAAPSSRRSLVPALVIGGVGVASVGVGAALLALSAGALADAKTNSTQLRADGHSCDPTFSNFAGTNQCAALAAQTAKVDTLHNAGLVPLVVGGAAIGGALLYALWPASAAKTEAASARLAPLLGRAEGGVLLSGRF
jgi:hypothetical protein